MENEIMNSNYGLVLGAFGALLLPFVLSVAVRKPNVRYFILSLAFMCGGLTHTDAAEVRWATRIISKSSQYDAVDYGAIQALGKPDVYPDHADDDLAWASLNEDSEREHIELEYDAPIQVQTVAIYETYNPGAIDMVSLRNLVTQEWEEVWIGTPSTAAKESRIFFVTFPKTSYLVDGVRIDLASSVVSGWNEIDAVAIVDDDVANVAPNIVPPDLSRLETVYPELDLEVVHIEVDVSDVFDQVNVVTMQFLDSDQNPVGNSVIGELTDGVAADGTWAVDPVIPHASASGWYGLRIIARNSNGSETTLDIPAVQQVSQMLLRPNSSFTFTKIAESGDYAATFDGNDFSVLGFEETPVMNESGQVAFEARLISTSPGSIQRNAVLIGDGTTLDIIVNDDEIPYSPYFYPGSPGKSIAINDSGWVAFRGTQPGDATLGIYKTDGTQIVEIDRGDESGSASPIGHAWINNSGQVSYYKYNLATLSYEVWVGDGSTTQMYYTQADLIVPKWMPGTGVVGEGDRSHTIQNMGMDTLLDDGSLISAIRLYNSYTSHIITDAIIRAYPDGRIRILEQANRGGAGTFYWQFGFPVAGSSAGNYVFDAYAGVNETPASVDPLFYVTTPTRFLVGRHGYKVKSTGLSLVAGNNANRGPSVNDLNIAAFMDSGVRIGRSTRPQTLNMIIETGPEIIIGEHHLFDGRRVDAATMSRGALNNSNQFVFRLYFADGHQALYRADPVQGLFVTPTFPVIENVNSVAGTIKSEFTSIPSYDWLKLPSSSEIEILLPNGGDLITEISGISRHLAEPVEVMIEGNLVGMINGQGSFDIAAVSGGGTSRVTLRNIIATPSFQGSLAVSLAFNEPAADVNVEASTAPLLVKPNTVPFLPGGQLILESSAIGNGDYDFQWFKDEMRVIESERVLDVEEPTLQINPSEAADAGNYKLVGTGIGGKTSSIQLQIFEGKTFDAWIGEFFPGESDADIISPAATPRADGVSNFTKFALGIDPTTDLSSGDLDRFLSIDRGQTGVPFSPSLRFAVNPEALGVQVGVESTEELIASNWTPLDFGSLTITETIENGAKEYFIQLPPSADPKHFYRASLKSMD